MINCLGPTVFEKTRHRLFFEAEYSAGLCLEHYTYSEVSFEALFQDTVPIQPLLIKSRSSSVSLSVTRMYLKN